MGKKQQQKKAKAAIIENQIKTNGTRTTLELDLVSNADLMRQVKENDRMCWGLTNMAMALQLINENAFDRVLEGFRKFGYNGDRIENIARSIRKMKFANNEMINAITPCYKETLLQSTTIGNLMMLFADLIGHAIGLTMDGKYCSSDFEVAYIPKTLAPAIRLAPGGDKIEWVSDTVDKFCKEGNDYLDRHDLNGNDVEFRVGRASKVKEKDKVKSNL